MKFSEFSAYLSKLEATDSRLEMNAILKDFFNEIKSSEEDEIRATSYLLLGTLAPALIDIKLNVSSKTIRKILVQKYGEAVIKEKFTILGDYGDLFAELADKRDSSDFSILDIYKKLLSIAYESGSGSAGKKQQIIENLLLELSPLEGKYFIRIILEKLRSGFSDKTFIESLSVYLRGDKSLRADIERAYGIHPDIGFIASKLIKSGEKGLLEIKVTPGVPMLPKLVQRESELAGILKRMGNVIVQPKYDGIRCQVHFSKSGFGGEENSLWQSPDDSANSQSNMFFEQVDEKNTTVKLFTRNLEELTDMFPEITAVIDQYGSRYDSFILDTEIIAKDPSTGKFLPFQETSKRRRKYDIDEKAKEIPVEIYLFDLLYFNGNDLTASPLSERLELLYKNFSKEDSPIINLTESPVIDSEESLEDYFKDYVGRGLEGLIAKDPNSIYKVGTRNYDWIKYKRASRSELADSVDVVVMGYFEGEGRLQVEFGIGKFLVGIYDANKDEILTIAKVGTGVTDQKWREIFKKFQEIRLEEKPSNYVIQDKMLIPDVYVKPVVICVVEADEISKSTKHSAGYALRFPRLKEFDRPDKDLKDTTSPEEVQKLYEIFIKSLNN